MDRRAFLKNTALAGITAAGPARASLLAQERAGERFEEVIPEQVEAIKKGLDFLVRSQGQSGAIGRTCQVAFTSLAGLAFMAGGNTPTRGVYAENVYKALRFIMRCVSKKGYINEGAGRGMGGSGMHGHGYGLLFLAELYGMCGEIQDQLDNESVKDAIARAVGLTEYAQDPNGGWLYDPHPNGHEGSVTVTQVQALRAARNVGIQVSQKVIDKGISYIKKSTAADGTIMYRLGMGSGGSYALTAAGACVYAYYGLYDDKMAEKCMKALYSFVSGKRHAGRNMSFDSYSTFYAGQACFFMKRKDPKYWVEGFGRIRKELLASQNKGSGSWTTDGYDGTYGTACATLVLQIPYRYLPIFQD
ncbi:MAG: terpene cyclase/mutase family protein [Planctomycetes bacterium]|nr:terpene cyclase/mutase family protein [Planctomycetota bacterium]